MSFNNPIRLFRDPAADQAALNNQLNITNSINQLIEQSLKEQRDLMYEINLELKNGINFTRETRKNYGVLEDISQKLVDDAEELVELTEKQLDREKVRATKALENLKRASEKLKISEQEILKNRKLTVQEEILKKAAENQFEIEKATLKQINDKIESQKRLNKAVGLTGALLKGSAGLMEKIGFSGTVVEGILKDAKNAAFVKAKNLELAGKNMDSLSTKTKTMFAGVKSLGAGLLKALKDPLVLLGFQLAIFKKIFDITKEQDELLTNQGRQLGISKEESAELYSNASKYAFSVHDSFVTAKRLTESQIELNKALGTSVEYGNQNNESFARLTHYYGLSAESAAKMVELGVEQGQNGMDILKSTTKTYGVLKAQYGGTISLNKVLDKVANVSDDIYIRFKGNPEAIAKAVMQADRLGLSLEKTADVGDSLLNFESSIESELKAELLTGKAINLEKARQYALSGDLTKLNEEITKQVGGIHEFEKMNVIQRKAYAEAFGMSVQDMSTMLRKQEFEAKLAGSTAKTAKEKLEYADKHGIAIDDQLRAQYEQKSLQDEQHEVFAKLKEVLVKITSGPMKVLYHQIEKILHWVGKIGDMFGGLSGGLGSKLGAALLLLPTIALIAKPLFSMFSSGGKSLFFERGTPMNPMVVTQIGGGISTGGMTLSPGQPFVQGRGPLAPNAPTRFNNYGAGNLSMNAAPKSGFNRMAVGGGLMVGGMALSGIASGMDEGAGKDTMGVLGQTATYAGMGAMFGPWGAAIGGLVGLGMGLFSLSKENEERRKAEAEKSAADAQRYKEMLDQFSIKPLQLSVGNESLAKFSTQQNLTNSSPNYA